MVSEETLHFTATDISYWGKNLHQILFSVITEIQQRLLPDVVQRICYATNTLAINLIQQLDKFPLVGRINEY